MDKDYLSRSARYDGDAYRAAVQMVRDSGAAIESLPEDKRPLVKELVRDAVKAVQDMHRRVYENRAVPPSFQPSELQVLRIIGLAVRGTIDAYIEIYEPATNDPTKMRAAGSDSDFETDKKGLDELPDIFG